MKSKTKITSTTDIRANEIIEEAKRFKSTSSRSMNYSDYERFKAKMHNECIFGYERELSNALGL